MNKKRHLLDVVMSLFCCIMFVVILMAQIELYYDPPYVPHISMIYCKWVASVLMQSMCLYCMWAVLTDNVI